jgi:hypothetical protein
VAAVYAAVIRRERQPCYLIMSLAAGWWIGYIILTLAMGLHMTPPRSDNWSGCTGLFAASLLYLIRRRNLAAVFVALCGFLAGGIGFAMGDFVQMLGRAQWGPIGRWETLQGLDYWKWMEQLFGLIMGAGVGFVFLKNMRAKLAPPAEDEESRNLNTVALIFLLIVMMWSNLHKNVRNWAKGDHIPDMFLGISTGWWFLLVGIVLSVVVLAAIIRHRRRQLTIVPSGEFGRGQLLLLIILWVAIAGAFVQAFPGMARKGVFFVHVSFWIAGGICSLIVVTLSDKTRPLESQLATCDLSWKPGLRSWSSLLLVPVLVIMLAWLTVSSHDKPLPGSHLRFARTAEP